MTRQGPTGEAQIIGVVSRKYKLLRRPEFFGVIEDLISDTFRNDLAGARALSRVADNGGWAQREYILPAITARIENLEGKAISEIGLRIIASNSYNRSRSASMYCGMIDFFCGNGMVLGSFIGRKLMRHTRGLDSSLFRETLQKTAQEFRIDPHEKARWAAIDVTEPAAAWSLEQHFSTALNQGLMARFAHESRQRGRSAWPLYSALTYYASHVSAAFPLRDDGSTSRYRILERRSMAVHHAVSSKSWRELLSSGRRVAIN